MPGGFLVGAPRHVCSDEPSFIAGKAQVDISSFRLMFLLCCAYISDRLRHCLALPDSRAAGQEGEES